MMVENGICLMMPNPSDLPLYQNKLIPHGLVTFTHEKNGFRIEGTWKHMMPGLHGFHIHQSGDMTDGCNSLCSHYNPTKDVHGGLTSKRRHMGDLGNIEVNEEGEAKFEWFETRMTLEELFGRSLIVHQDPDDLGKGTFEDSQTTGHSGKRILWGIIARKKNC